MNLSPARQWLRNVAVRGARRTLDALDEPAAPTPPPEPTPPRRTEPLPQALGVEHHPATEILEGRLTDEDRDDTQMRMDADPAVGELMANVPELDRRRLRLAYAMHFARPATIAHLGLVPDQPPDDVHTMTRGPLASAGGIYEADLVADALASVGVEIGRLRSALDFGCSSGRVVRVLASCYPEIAWHGCDPNAPAIAWARDHLPGIRFFRSPQRPPLDLPDASLDLVYAISIWSHFEPRVGLRWLEEMRRVIRPDGHIVLTTHGTTTVEHDMTRGLRSGAQLADVADALATRSTWYHPEFGEEGDWGVVDADWGTAFVTPEWLLAHLLPAWRLVEFAPGRNAGNQDVYVLQRR